MNFIDRVVGFFNPNAGVRRAIARELLSQQFKYDGASKKDRLGGWVTPSTSANAAMSGFAATLRDRSRDLARNNPYASKAKRAGASNCIGAGIKAQIKNKRNQDAGDLLEDLWESWAETTKCDADGVLGFYGIQSLVFKTIFESGEVLIRRRKRRADSGLKVPFQLQVLEGDYLDESKDFSNLSDGRFIYKGIEFNKRGTPVAYHLYTQHPGDDRLRSLSTNSVRVPASEIIHLFRVDRPGQVRGVPWMAPAVVQIKEFQDYESAQLVRQKIAACYMAFVRDIDSDAPTSSLTKNEAGQFIDKITPATIEFLPYGRDITFANPPGVEGYGEYSVQILRGIATGSGVPYEVLTGDYSKVNFSSARMGWLEFQREITEWQRDIFLSNFLPRVWDWFAEYAGILGYDVDSAKVTWIPQKREMIDPVKETTAAIKEVRAGFKPLSEAIREQGRDPDEVIEQIARDNEKLDSYEIKVDTDPRHVTQSGQSQADSSDDNSKNDDGSED